MGGVAGEYLFGALRYHHHCLQLLFGREQHCLLFKSTRLGNTRFQNFGVGDDCMGFGAGLRHCI